MAAMPRYPVNLPFAVFAADTQGRVRYRLPLVTYTNLFTPIVETVWMSPQVKALTGYTPAEWIDTPGFFDSILHRDDREPVLEESRLSRTELRPFSRDYRLIARSGETIWVHDESVPVLDKEGCPEFIQGYFVDLTERKALEQQLLHSQKTEDSDASPPTSPTTSTICSQRSEATPRCVASRCGREQGQSDLIQIVRPRRAQRSLSNNCSAFCRQRTPEPRATDIQKVVGEVRSMLAQIAGRRSHSTSSSPPRRSFYVDPGQLEQVIVNLVANARDAMPTGGTVSIATGRGSVAGGHESSRFGSTPQILRTHGRRHRRRDRAGHAQQHLRPFLHHEGARTPAPALASLDGARDHREEWGRDRRRRARRARAPRSESS